MIEPPKEIYRKGVALSIIGTDNNISDKDRNDLIDIGSVAIEDSDPEKRVSSLQRVNESFYNDFGHYLGHYFRNVYYLLNFIEQSERPIEFSKIFRAQLSRYELTMLYYNLLSKLSGSKFIKLMINYDIFNGIYWADICYNPDNEKMKHDLNVVLKSKTEQAG